MNSFSLQIKTSSKRQLKDITDLVSNKLTKESSLVHVFIKHTTAGVMVADMDPGAEVDYLQAFEHIIPQLEYQHPHNPTHMPDHILAALIGANVTIPVHDQQLVLGNWQRIVLVECDGPRTRDLVITCP